MIKLFIVLAAILAPFRPTIISYNTDCSEWEVFEDDTQSMRACVHFRTSGTDAVEVTFTDNYGRITEEPILADVTNQEGIAYIEVQRLWSPNDNASPRLILNNNTKIHYINVQMSPKTDLGETGRIVTTTIIFSR